jgi:hypothetical protein
MQSAGVYREDKTCFSEHIKEAMDINFSFKKNNFIENKNRGFEVK